MASAGTILRRTFLIGSAAVAGGVAFGVFAVRRDPDNPLSDAPEGTATFNPWIMIDARTVTLITPHADVGQGAVSMQAALLAEEMDLDWGGFETSFGEPAQAYWNRAFGPEAVPSLPWDTSVSEVTWQSIVNHGLKIAGAQMTGGSTSVPDSYDKLRQAGAVARETLKLAASHEHGVPTAELRSESGAVILPDDTRVPYTALAARAATLEPVHDAQVRDGRSDKLVGKPMLRQDIVAKSTGALLYGIDMTVPGMVHASVRVNPRKGGAVNGFDASRARAMPGVLDVLPIAGGVAAVARNTWTAMQAVNAIDVDWGPAPYPAEQADHWRACFDAIREENKESERLNTGDVEAAAAQGTAIEAEYRAPYVAHQPLEPMSAIVLVKADRVDVWAGHQIPPYLQEQVAIVTGHRRSQVVFHNQFSGGSFGARLEFEFVKQAADVARQMPGTPVKMTLSREEDFAQDIPRQIAVSRARGSVADGQVTGLDIQIAMPSIYSSEIGRIGMLVPGTSIALPTVPFDIPGGDPSMPSGVWQQPYAFPNARVRTYTVRGLSPVSSWRSVGASTGGFFAEGFLDEMIHAAGADPMEERLRLCTPDPVSRKVLEAAAEMCNWSGAMIGPGRGRGVALVWSFGVPVAEVVEVTATDRGIRIDTVWVAADVGRVVDPVNFENQVQGGVIWGLGHAMNSEITYADGMAEQTNYHAHEGMRLYQTPEIIVRGLENGDVRGVGEPPVPPAAPALANAIFAATGKRLREMPFARHVDFV